MKRIKNVGREPRKIDPEELAKCLGAKLIKDAPSVNDPMGTLSALSWFSRRQSAIRKAHAAGIDADHHIRFWLRSSGKSVSGRVEEISESPNGAFSVLVACVDGGEISLCEDDIDRIMDFGKPLAVQKVGRYKGWKWWEK